MTQRNLLTAAADLAYQSSKSISIEGALMHTLGLGSDAAQWDEQKTRQYCQALDLCRKFIDRWSVSGWSEQATSKQVADVLSRAAGIAANWEAA